MTGATVLDGSAATANESPAYTTAGDSSRDHTGILVSGGAVELLILAELQAINAKLDRAETAGSAVAKLVADHVAPMFAKLAANPRIAKLLRS